ncbi:MAG: PorT family protein [Bacteroidetes bacterium]|nr:PorT family protein [Bacteroidota bacterium]
MYSINSGHLLYIHWRKVVFSILLTGIFLGSSFAQTAKGNYNFLDFQQKPYYFGITLAMNTSNYNIFRSKEFIQNDSIINIESITGPGFNLGIVTNLKIGNYFDFRFLPTLSFAERNIRYGRDSKIAPLSKRKIESVFVEMPFHVRYKSQPFKDMRLFVIAGVKYSFDVASDSRTRQADTLVKVSPTDFQLETGAGIQIFFPYFIFSPEIKISHGIGNTLLYDGNLEESTVLEKILSRTFTLSFHFEG